MDSYRPVWRSGETTVVGSTGTEDAALRELLATGVTVDKLTPPGVTVDSWVEYWNGERWTR